MPGGPDIGQLIFSQGAWNWEGDAIRKSFTSSQIDNAERDDDDNVSMTYDKLVNIDVN